jgi:hypothetical protein
MKTLLLAVLLMLASAGIAAAQTAPAQTKSQGQLDLEYKQRTPALRPVPPRKLEEDTAQAVRELSRQRTDRMLREAQPTPSRRPDLDRDVTQGIQTRGLNRQ